MHVVQIAGLSGSGKTTLIVELIRHFSARGMRVGAMKHTHHPLNMIERGDTERFREAGAIRVLLAGQSDALIDGKPQPYASPAELLHYFHETDLLLIEGFRDYVLGTRIDLEQEPRAVASDIMANLDRIWGSS